MFMKLTGLTKEIELKKLLLKISNSEGGVLIERDSWLDVMGGFNFQMGQDEKGSYVAYSDIWDLKVVPENEKGFFGKPFHIYDRLYYNPETFELYFE